MNSTAWGLQHPEFLALGCLLLALFAALCWRFEQTRCSLRKLLGLIPNRSQAAIVVPSILVLLLCLALSRPYSGWSEITVHKAASETFFVVDISRSMLATDLSPNRLEAAKRKILDALKWFARNSPGERVGIVLFSGESYVFCPVTTDYEVVRSYTQSISPQLIRAQGSSLVSAVRLASASFGKEGKSAARMLVLSDGEQLDFELGSVKELIAEHSLRISAIGFGTPEGSAISLGQGVLLKDAHGKVVTTRLKEDNLRRLSELGHGAYSRASLDESDLNKVLPEASQPRPTSGNAREQTVRSYRELGPWLAIAAALFALAGLVLSPHSLALFVGLGFSFLLCLPITAIAEPSTTAGEAQRAYQAGDYAGALPGFEREVQRHPNDAQAWIALGHTRYRLQDFAGAETAYSKAEELSRSGHELFESRYNRGNSLLQKKEPEEAIKAYESALAVKPGDAAATFNRELAQKLQQQKPPPQDKKSKDDKKKSPSPSPSASSSASPSASSSPEPQSSPSPSGSDSASPSPHGSESASSSPSPEGSAAEPGASSSPSLEPSPEPEASQHGDSSPSASPSPESSSPNASPSPQAEESPHSAEGAESPSPTPKDPDGQAMLEAFSDAPVLLRRHVGRGDSRSEQTW